MKSAEISDTDLLDELLRRAPISAIMDSARRNRHSLTREVGDASCGGRPILFCGYNPSTADETVDDRTLRREIGFTRALNGDYLIKVNLLTYRATDPNEIDFAEAERTFEENNTRVADLAALMFQAGERLLPSGAPPKGRRDRSPDAKQSAAIA